MTRDCERVLSRLGEPLSGELLAHVQSCPECQQVQQSYGLLRAGERLPSRAPSITLPAAAVAQFRKHPRAWPWWWGAAALVLIYVGLIWTGVAVLGTPEKWGDRPLPLALRSIGIGLALISTIGLVAGLAPRARRVRTALFPLLGALLVGIPLSAPFTENSDAFVAEGIPCLTVEVVMSGLPIGLGIWLLTRSAFHPIRSLLLPFCAATAGLVVLCFHCSNGLTSHLLVFHLAPWLALAGLAWAVRAKTHSYSYAP